MRALLRIRFEGAEVIEIDPDRIRALQIITSEDNCAEYALVATTDGFEYMLCIGNFDKCHAMLNRLHDILDIRVMDV